MLKVYETLRNFDGMDEGQHFWYFDYAHDDTFRQMHAVTDDGDDAERLIETWLIENTDYTSGDEFDVINDDAYIGNLGVMMRTDETVKAMLDEMVAYVRETWNRESFVIDDDWNMGFKRGRRSTTMPTTPIGRDAYHYQQGVVCGMYVKLAKMTGAEVDFIKTWLMPQKAAPAELATSEGGELVVTN